MGVPLIESGGPLLLIRQGTFEIHFHVAARWNSLSSPNGQIEVHGHCRSGQCDKARFQIYEYPAVQPAAKALTCHFVSQFAAYINERFLTIIACPHSC